MNHQWHWQTWQDRSYLCCNLLSAWQHGFFTAEFYPQTPEDLTQIIWSQTSAFRVKQVHGNEVLSPSEIATIVNQENYDRTLAEADAVVSDRYGQSVWVASADCTPLLIGDRVTGQVAAIHAGWRGTAQKIVSQAIARFLKSGSNKADLRIAIGPAISGAMYQVDQTVAVEVGKSLIADAEQKNAGEILAELKEMPATPILPDKLPGKLRLDVPRVNQIQLEQLGINSTQIAIAPYCTYQSKISNELSQPELANYSYRFFSYRRTGAKKVQWSGIVSQ